MQHPSENALVKIIFIIWYYSSMYYTPLWPKCIMSIFVICNSILILTQDSYRNSFYNFIFNSNLILLNILKCQRKYSGLSYNYWLFYQLYWFYKTYRSYKTRFVQFFVILSENSQLHKNISVNINITSEDNQRHSQNPFEHLRWSVLQK